jgi:hypothetical protein
MTSSVGMIPNIWKNKKCSKPPTIYIYTLFGTFRCTCTCRMYM